MKQSEFRSDPGKQREWEQRSRKPLKRTASTKRRRISEASPAQRAKVKEAVSIVSGQPGCDPAHLVPRSLGGCDDALCVVPLTREEHRAYDAGELDLSPCLHNLIPEMQHALEHLRSPLRLIHKLTGVRHIPETPDQDRCCCAYERGDNRTCPKHGEAV